MSINARAKKKVTSVPVDVRSEGQRLLRELDVKRAEVADVCGVSGPLVSQWRTGKKVPTSAARSALAEKYGIPPEAWDVVPGAVPPAAPLVPSDKIPSSASASRAPDTLEDALEQRDRLLQMLEMNLIPTEQTRVEKLIAENRQEIKRHQDEEREKEPLDEDKIVRSDPWNRLWGEVIDELRSYPDAMRALAARFCGKIPK